ncbi:hypothetical protein NL676_036592 [Syzygium grande]|nr:hypothetical protein NL676_036592 [Syzygium grande]
MLKPTQLREGIPCTQKKQLHQRARRQNRSTSLRALQAKLAGSFCRLVKGLKFLPPFRWLFRLIMQIEGVKFEEHLRYSGLATPDAIARPVGHVVSSWCTAAGVQLFEKLRPWIPRSQTASPPDTNLFLK